MANTQSDDEYPMEDEEDEELAARVQGEHDIDAEAEEDEGGSSDEDGGAGGSFQSADNEEDDFDLPQDVISGVGGHGEEDEQEDFHQVGGGAASGGGLPPGLDESEGAGAERWNLRKDGNKEQLEPIWARLSTDREHVKISKMFSYVLRHAAHKLGVWIRKDGFVRLREIMKLRNFKPYTLEELMAAVYFDEKERYTMVREFDGELLIRANQGHTMKVVEDDLLLEPIVDPTDVSECVHGTYLVHWPFIKRQGLSKVARNHIHLANGLPEDGKIRGMRSTAELFVYVDVPLAMEDGVVFYRSKNDVILTQGFDGWLPVKYFQKAVRIDYNTCDIEELEFDVEGVPIPDWPAELAPSGPGEQGTYLIKNLEALISNCRKRLQEINELKALQDRGRELEDEDQDKVAKHAQVYTELQSLEQRFRQHKGYRRESAQDKEQRAKEAAEATTVVKRKDRALTPPWDNGKSHLESVGMKSTEKEKAEWAALGRRRNHATAGPSKEDQWAVLGRGRFQTTPTTPAGAQKRESTPPRGSKGSKAGRGDDFQRGGHDIEDEDWRAGREDRKLGRSDTGLSIRTDEQVSTRSAATPSGPPRFFNSKKSSDSLSWRERMALTEMKEVEEQPRLETPSWREQMAQPQRAEERQSRMQLEHQQSWRDQMQRTLSQPMHQPPPQQQHRSEGPMQHDPLGQQPPHVGETALQREHMVSALPSLEHIPPPPPQSPAPLCMPTMLPNPKTPSGMMPQPGGSGVPLPMMPNPLSAQARPFCPPTPTGGGGGLPQMMPNPLVTSGPPPSGGSGMAGMMPAQPASPSSPSGGSGPAMMPGHMGQPMSPTRGGMAMGGGGMQGGSSLQAGSGSRQGGCGMQSSGAGGMQGAGSAGGMPPAGGMLPAGGLQAGGGMPGEAGVGRFMMPMWQAQQMQGGQVCGYGPNGQAQLYCPVGGGAQGNNFGTGVAGQQGLSAGASNWMGQVPQYMQAYDQNSMVMPQPSSPQGNVGMQQGPAAGSVSSGRGGPCGEGGSQGFHQATNTGNFNHGYPGSGDHMMSQQGSGQCFGIGNAPAGGEGRMGMQQGQGAGFSGYDGYDGFMGMQKGKGGTSFSYGGAGFNGQMQYPGEKGANGPGSSPGNMCGGDGYMGMPQMSGGTGSCLGYDGSENGMGSRMGQMGTGYGYKGADGLNGLKQQQGQDTRFGGCGGDGRMGGRRQGGLHGSGSGGEKGAGWQQGCGSGSRYQGFGEDDPYSQQGPGSMQGHGQAKGGGGKAGGFGAQRPSGKGSGRWQQDEEQAHWQLDAEEFRHYQRQGSSYSGYDDYGGDSFSDYDTGDQWRKGSGKGRGKDGGGKGGKKSGKGSGKDNFKAGKSRDRDDAQDWAALGRLRANA